MLVVAALILQTSCIHHGITPKYSEWIVTMWHFGADASIEYSGDKFSVTWGTAENVLVRAYSKVMGDNKTRIRLERQEYPRTTLADAIEQKIKQQSEIPRANLMKYNESQDEGDGNKNLSD